MCTILLATLILLAVIEVAARPFVLVLYVRPESSSIVFASVKNAIRLFVALVPAAPVPSIVPVPKLEVELLNLDKSNSLNGFRFWVPPSRYITSSVPTIADEPSAKLPKSRLNV